MILHKPRSARSYIDDRPVSTTYFNMFSCTFEISNSESRYRSRSLTFFNYYSNITSSPTVVVQRSNGKWGNNV